MHGALPIVVVMGLLLVGAGCVTTAGDWNQKGVTDHTLGRYGEAVGDFDQALALDPGYAAAWKNRGLSLAMLGKKNESEESFARAIALAPDDAGVHYYQALARNVTGDRPGALESAGRAVAISPRSRDEGITLHSALTFQGDLLVLEGRHDEANLSYQKAHQVLMSTI